MVVDRVLSMVVWVSFSYISTTFCLKAGLLAPKIPRMRPSNLIFDVIDFNFDHDDLDFEV